MWVPRKATTASRQRCIVEQVVLTTSRAVANADVVDVVDMIRRAKEQIPDRLKGNAEVMIGEQELSDLQDMPPLPLRWASCATGKMGSVFCRPWSRRSTLTLSLES